MDLNTQPELLYPARSHDRIRLGELRSSAHAVFDTFLIQLRDLLKTRKAGQFISDGEMQAEVERYLNGRPTGDCGVWVFFPWLNRLVHVLDENEFVELRTNRNRYKILPEEQELLARKKVGVVGLSVGQSVALTMTLERGFGEIRLADFDTLDLSNMNRIRTPIYNLHVPKVAITAREIAEIDPFLKTVCYFEGLTEQNVDEFLVGKDGNSRLDIVVEECDNLAMKILVRQKARSYGIPVVMDTSDCGMMDVERFDLEPNRPILHGLIEDMPPEKAKNLTDEEKLTCFVKILGNPERTSPRAIVSGMEIGRTICTWPQLAADVIMGGAVAAETVRRIHLQEFTGSGRYYVSASEIIADKINNHPPPEAKSMKAKPTVNGTSLPERKDLAQVRQLVELACLAPSGGNSQPWKWVFQENTLHLFLDPERAPMASMTDFRRLASYASLGAATETARLAARRLGLPVKIQEFPVKLSEDPNQDIEVARIHFADPAHTAVESDASDVLAEFIESRCTGRKPGQRQALPESFVSELRSSIEREGDAGFQFISSDTQLAEMSSILGACDRIRFFSKPFHTELMRELRFTREETERTRDGLDVDTLELQAIDRTGLSMSRSWATMQLLNKLGGGSRLERAAHRSVTGASMAALITVKDVTPQSFFTGGRAMQRAWLTATRHDIRLHPVASPPYFFARLLHAAGEGFDKQKIQELHRLRERYKKLFKLHDSEGEVLLFLLSVAEPASARSIRRPVESILEFR